MKNSIIWTTAGIAAVGFGVPAYAAITSPAAKPQIVPAGAVVVTSSDDSTSSSSPNTSTVTVVSTPASLPTISLAVVTTANSTVNSVDDISGNCDEAEHANDANCVGVNAPGVATASTPTSVEDISGPCDEAEHANDPRCTGGAGPVTSVDDNSGPVTTVDDSSGRGSNSGHGSDDSGHGSDDSGHGGGSDG